MLKQAEYVIKRGLPLFFACDFAGEPKINQKLAESMFDGGLSVVYVVPFGGAFKIKKR